MYTSGAQYNTVVRFSRGGWRVEMVVVECRHSSIISQNHISVFAKVWEIKRYEKIHFEIDINFIESIYSQFSVVSIKFNQKQLYWNILIKSPDNRIHDEVDIVYVDFYGYFDKVTRQPYSWWSRYRRYVDFYGYWHIIMCVEEKISYIDTPVPNNRKRPPTTT